MEKMYSKIKKISKNDLDFELINGANKGNIDHDSYDNIKNRESIAKEANAFSKLRKIIKNTHNIVTHSHNYSVLPSRSITSRNKQIIPNNKISVSKEVVKRSYQQIAPITPILPILQRPKTIQSKRHRVQTVQRKYQLL